VLAHKSNQLILVSSYPPPIPNEPVVLAWNPPPSETVSEQDLTALQLAAGLVDDSLPPEENPPEYVLGDHRGLSSYLWVTQL
jgi:hypothetical protein